MKNRIYEHLKTRKKFNTLQLKYDVKCDELQAKIIELNTEKKVKAKQQELYDSKIKELTEENIELKTKITELKKELKKCTKAKEK
jgi:chromosome segregation ATPase